MTENRSEWEGRVVDGRFPLRRYLGGGEHSAVFVTTREDQEPEQTAIKLVSTDPTDAELQLARWESAAKLSHPHLMRLFQMGRCRLDGQELLYVVMERAEEDLSQVLPQRPLSTEEARGVLEATSEALAYLHAQGFVHGDVRPANIMAAGDRLKLSSDGLRRAGESRGKMAPAGEGALPAGLPEPFLEIARHCVERDPRRRWTAEEIRTRLVQAVATPRQTRVKLRRVLVTAALAVALALAAMMGMPTLPNRYQEHRQAPPAPPQAQSVPAEPERKAAAPEAVSTGGVAEQVLPDVPGKARNSIQGSVRVAVKVRVDPSGSVAEGQLASPGPSRYFAGLALEAARRWRFSPPRTSDGAVASEWLLRFQFDRSATNMRPEQAAQQARSIGSRESIDPRQLSIMIRTREQNGTPG